MGPVNYEITTSEKTKKKQVFHVNLLKEWKDRPQPAHALLIHKAQDIEEWEESFPSSEAASTPEISHLPPDEKEELATMFSTFPGSFTEKHGYTDIVQHNIILTDKLPIRQCGYRVPERLLLAVKEELNTVLRLNIIEPSSSAWSNQ